MKLALVSDLHGNAVGLEAVVRDLDGERFDEIVCLGDVAQGGPQPALVVDRLRELGWPCVLGNADEFVLTLDPGTEATDPERERRLLEVARWSSEQLGEQGRAYLRDLPPTIELEPSGRRLICCHATPTAGLAYEHVEPREVERFEPCAEYAVLTVEDGKQRLEFRRAPYDVDELLDPIARSGMPNADAFAARWRSS